MRSTAGAVKKKTIDEAIICLYFLPVFDSLTAPVPVKQAVTTDNQSVIKTVAPDRIPPASRLTDKERRSRYLHTENLSTPSISGILGGQEASGDVPVSSLSKSKESLLQQPFDATQLVEAWKEFAVSVDAAQLRSALSVREPFLVNESTVGYNLDNEVQLQRISMDLKPKLLAHLHNSLQNEKINLEFNVTENKTEIINRPYTNQEKFNVLSAKYPVLGLIKQQFGLDFE